MGCPYTLFCFVEYRIYPIANFATFLHIEAILKAACNICQIKFSPSFGAKATFMHEAAKIDAARFHAKLEALNPNH